MCTTDCICINWYVQHVMRGCYCICITDRVYWSVCITSRGDQVIKYNENSESVYNSARAFLRPAIDFITMITLGVVVV